MSLLPQMVHMHSQALQIVNDLEDLIVTQTLLELEAEGDRRALEHIATLPGWRLVDGKLLYSAGWLDDDGPRLEVVK